MQSQKQWNDLCSLSRQTIQYHRDPSLPRTVMLKKLNFNESMKIYKTSELIPRKDVLFIKGDWTVNVGSQEIPGITGKFGLGVQNEAGKRLTEFCQENDWL